MPDVTIYKDHIPAMSEDSIAKVRALEAEVLKLPQEDIKTTHHLHAGLYSRTIVLKPDIILTAVLIKIPTLLIISGDCTVFVGDETQRFTGYNVIMGSAHRMQACITHAETSVSMIFPTSAKTIEEAEDEFTDEGYKLFSRRGNNEIHIGDIL